MFENFNNIQSEMNDVPWNTERSWDALDSWQEDYIRANYTTEYKANTSGSYDWEDESYEEEEMLFDNFDIFHNGNFVATTTSYLDIMPEILEHFFEEMCCQDLYEEWR